MCFLNVILFFLKGLIFPGDFKSKTFSPIFVLFTDFLGIHKSLLDLEKKKKKDTFFYKGLGTQKKKKLLMYQICKQCFIFELFNIYNRKQIVNLYTNKLHNNVMQNI